jgi:glutathione S-transferase
LLTPDAGSPAHFPSKDNAMTIDLYYAPFSSSSRVHWAVRELGFPCNEIKIDLKGTTHKTAEYLAMNPNGRVPLLVVDGTPLFESVAILLYLGDRFGADQGLWPAADDPARLVAMSWVVWSSSELGSAAVRYLHAAGEPKGAIATAARAEIERLLGLLEQRLDGRRYLLGDAFSLVDVALASAAGWIQHALGVDLAPFPRLSAWVPACTDRPACRATMVP